MWNILKAFDKVPDASPVLSTDEEALLVRAREVLRGTFGYDAFRGGQEAVILSLLKQRDTLAIMPTGQGKSLCYQVPALMLPGLTLVISPLIALMKDQVDSLKKIGYPAAVINSQTALGEQERIFLELTQRRLKLLFVAPERLQNERFIGEMRRVEVSLVAVDEAHCISEWGYDFRPSYQKIADGISKLSPAARPATLALTATATTEVLRDIKGYLALQNPYFHTGGFERDNLSLSVFAVENKRQKLLNILQGVSGASVVYTMSRKMAEDTAFFLRSQGMTAAYYHAGLSDTARSEIQEKFFANDYRAICATNAFGMGINKADVRTVVHLDLPETLEAYYQEAGRAGRDGVKSFAVMLYAKSDIDKRRYMIENSYPAREDVEHVFKALASLATRANEVIIEKEKLLVMLVANRKDNFGAVKLDAAIGVLKRYGLASELFEAEENESLKVLVPREELETWIKSVEAASQAAHRAVLEQLLRSFGGECFVNRVGFSLGVFAAKAGLKADDVLRVFQAWLAAGLAEFASEKTISLALPMPQLDSKKLPVDWKFLDLRKKVISEKFGEVLRYIRHTGCRRNYVLDYFGESHYTEHCGLCDACTGRHARKML